MRKIASVVGLLTTLFLSTLAEQRNSAAKAWIGRWQLNLSRSSFQSPKPRSLRIDVLPGEQALNCLITQAYPSGTAGSAAYQGKASGSSEIAIVRCHRHDLECFVSAGQKYSSLTFRSIDDKQQNSPSSSSSEHLSYSWASSTVLTISAVNEAEVSTSVQAELSRRGDFLVVNRTIKSGDHVYHDTLLFDRWPQESDTPLRTPFSLCEV